MKFLEYLQHSFNNTSLGASARKLTIFWIMLLVTISDIVYLFKGNFASFILFISVHFIVVLILFGIIHIKDILDAFTIWKKG
jgi:hypothetical protein